LVARLTELPVNMLALKKARLAIGDQRLGPFGQPLVAWTLWLRHSVSPPSPSRSRTRGSDTVSAPKVSTSCRGWGVAIALGRALALIAQTAAQRRLRRLFHQSLNEGADANADRILQGIKPILTGKWNRGGR
tara:strand:- start:1899 stop:2294 length:396 start_codon:yes stop_codon:yes gene_type:complete